MRPLLTLGLALGLLGFCPPDAHALFLVRVSNVSDFSLPAWSVGDGTVDAHIDLCIYTEVNLPVVGGYAMTVTSSTGSFVLKDVAKQLPFSLYWKDGGFGGLGGGLGTAVSHGVKLSGLQNGNVLSSSCAITGPNARLNLRLLGADLTAALAGNYKADITLLLSPT